MEAKGPSRVPVLQAHWKGLPLILQTTIHLTLKTNVHDYVHKHTLSHTHTQTHQSGRGRVLVQGGLKVEGHFKRAKSCPRELGGGADEGGRRGNSLN